MRGGTSAGDGFHGDGDGDGELAQDLQGDDGSIMAELGGVKGPV